MITQLSFDNRGHEMLFVCLRNPCNTGWACPEMCSSSFALSPANTRQSSTSYGSEEAIQASCYNSPHALFLDDSSLSWAPCALGVVQVVPGRILIGPPAAVLGESYAKLGRLGTVSPYRGEHTLSGHREPWKAQYAVNSWTYCDYFVLADHRKVSIPATQTQA